PSNIHDNPYAIGAVDFTGDMPVILGPDGPSLGGFVCPVSIIEADLWQLGQLKAGDKLRFVPVDIATARQLAKARREECALVSPLPPGEGSGVRAVSTCAESPSPQSSPGGRGGVYAQAAEYTLTSPIVLDIGQGDCRLVARLSGDTHLLLEIGEPELDLVLRFRGHALMQALEAKTLDGVIDLTPGIRSLQVHYQPETLTLADLLGIVAGEWDAVCAARDLKVPSRIVHLPLSWDDPACQLAIDKYMTTVRKDAPWCPSNLEFIRRINDLPNLDEVYRTVFEASYLVMG
ncbi:carboxyltransferase domain-containing protein, partial [Pseudomonas sp. CrR25]|nr:carboxyltransferase domain-containing protein [Pseudomonas sp. CrR25]